MYGINEDKRYFNVPYTQVLGKFNGNEISYDALDMLYDKILIKPFTPVSEGVVKNMSDNTTVGEVVKVGPYKLRENGSKSPLKVKVGDIVLIKDNVTTDITFDVTTYKAAEEFSVVGIFKDKDNLSLDNMTFINKSILMNTYIPEKLLGSDILLTPVLNYEDLDYSDIYNGNRMKVEYVDSELTDLKKHDIIFIDKNVTNYVYFNNKKYCITNGLDYVEGKLIP